MGVNDVVEWAARECVRSAGTIAAVRATATTCPPCPACPSCPSLTCGQVYCQKEADEPLPWLFLVVSAALTVGYLIGRLSLSYGGEVRIHSLRGGRGIVA